VAAAKDPAVWPEGNEESTGSSPTTNASRLLKGRLRGISRFSGPCTSAMAANIAAVDARPARRPREPSRSASQPEPVTHPIPLPRSDRSSIWSSQ